MAAHAGKSSGLYCEGNDWYWNASLPSDIKLVMDGFNFHLHKFPLISRCGKIAKFIEQSPSTYGKTIEITLEDFPGGVDTFLTAVKFCYGGRIEFTPRNIVSLYCAADYLDMTDDYGEDNLLSESETFFHKQVLKSWKNCILALKNCEPIFPSLDKLHIVIRCLDALSVMVCTDPSLFGWPMMMYGSLQSPGGSILWNGINTGAKIHSFESDWWFEDVSYLGIELFERLIQTMEAKGIRPENLVRAIMYYCKKYLLGLDRWKGGQGGVSRTVASFSMRPAVVDQLFLLERVVKLLPEKKGKSFCRFLLGLLRVALILGANRTCLDSLEGRIGIQLELATLDGLLIPSYSDSDTLYDTDCVERMICIFVSSEPKFTSVSPSSLDREMSPLTGRWKKVTKLVDNYIAEVASDVNLKPEKIRSLAEALPESSRSLHDGLYRALDIYFKVRGPRFTGSPLTYMLKMLSSAQFYESIQCYMFFLLPTKDKVYFFCFKWEFAELVQTHPWLSEKEREQLCSIIDFQKLSIDACALASHNERLPLRVTFQVLYFEQIQLKTALARYRHVLDDQNAPAASLIEMSGRVVHQDGWITIVRENHVLKTDMERMRPRVEELEQEFGKIKEEMKRVAKSHSYLSSPHFIARRIGCDLLVRRSNAQSDILDSTTPTPRASVEQARPSTPHSHNRKGLSLF